jgi:hypothetical protein
MVGQNGGPDPRLQCQCDEALSGSPADSEKAELAASDVESIRWISASSMFLTVPEWPEGKKMIV